MLSMMLNDLSTRFQISEHDAQTVKSQELAPTNITCAESKSFVGLPESNATLCSDREGNALVADQAGFAVLTAVRNPFVFCNSPSTVFTTTNCQGSEVLSVFQPRAGGEDALLALSPKEEVMPPIPLAFQIMHRQLTCEPWYNQHRVCIERRLKRRERRLQRRSRKKLPQNARIWVQDFLSKLATACEDEEYENEE